MNLQTRRQFVCPHVCDSEDANKMGSGFAARPTAADFDLPIGDINVSVRYLVGSFDIAYVDPIRVIR